MKITFWMWLHTNQCWFSDRPILEPTWVTHWWRSNPSWKCVRYHHIGVNVCHSIGFYFHFCVCKAFRCSAALFVIHGDDMSVHKAVIPLLWSTHLLHMFAYLSCIYNIYILYFGALLWYIEAAVYSCFSLRFRGEFLPSSSQKGTIAAF